MKSLKDIVRTLRQDDRVLPRKPLTQQERQALRDEEDERERRRRAEKFKQPAEGIRVEKRVGSGATVTQRPVEPTRLSRPEPARESTTLEKLDPTCTHQWQWKGGVKSCWLCGSAAPLDKRDNSTRWKG